VKIQQWQVSFPTGPVVDELEAFEYETTPTGVRFVAPQGMHDDCVCALALAAEHYKHQFGQSASDHPRIWAAHRRRWDLFGVRRHRRVNPGYQE